MLSVRECRMETLWVEKWLMRTLWEARNISRIMVKFSNDQYLL